MSSPYSRPASRRDSWPPTQMRLHPSIESDNTDIDDMDLLFMDDDPLNYFLTTAPSSQDDTMDLDLDFDAGIDTPKRPVPIVRSVSPSSLNGGGLTGLPLRPPTPPRTFSSPSPEPDLDMAPTPEDDGESYLRFGSPATPTYMPFSLKDFTSATGRSKSRGRGKGATLLKPGPLPSARGRVSQRPGPRPLGALDARGKTKSSSGRISPHAWREPSPDVWSIEEETEEDVVNSEMGDSHMAMSEERTKAIDIPGRVVKRVRFVLPVRETV